MKLNVGCGEDIRTGYINIDKYSDKENVLILDVERESLPYRDGSIDEIICNQVIEHLSNPEFVIKEMERVLKKGGRLIVSIPTYSYTFCHNRPRNTRNTFDVLFSSDLVAPSYVGGTFKLSRFYGTRNSGLLRWILFRLKTKIQDFLDTTLHQHLVWELEKK